MVHLISSPVFPISTLWFAKHEADNKAPVRFVCVGLPWRGEFFLQELFYLVDIDLNLAVKGDERRVGSWSEVLQVCGLPDNTKQNTVETKNKSLFMFTEPSLFVEPEKATFNATEREADWTSFLIFHINNGRHFLHAQRVRAFIELPEDDIQVGKQACGAIIAVCSGYRCAPVAGYITF